MAAESHEEMVRRLITQRQSCAQIRPNAYSCAQSYESHTFEPRKKTDEEIAINVLTEENAKLKEQYADLVKKTTILVKEYRRLEEENKVFKQKKAKQDSVKEAFNGVGKAARDVWDKIILWFNT